MSFSSDVKAELCGIYPSARHCAIAEIAAIINTCGSATRDAVRIQTENAVIAKKFYTLVKTNFSIQSQVSIKNHKKFAKSRIYCIIVSEQEAAGRIAHATGIESGRGLSALTVRSDCCKRAYIRGAFISGGSLSDPEKTYHLEFVNTEQELLKGLSGLMRSYGLRAKVIGRKSHYIAYLKEGENIVDLLNLMGAHLSLMNLENVRIVKDMRNSVNRIVNCETANLSKTVSAAQKQIRDIEFISAEKGLGFLSKQLEEAARARRQYPEANLKEIGEMLSPPVGKSGVNHRLRKISEIADSIRGGEL